MKTTFKFLPLAYLFILIYSINGFAYTLDQLMEHAALNRDIVKQYITNLEKSKEDTKYNKGNFYPSIDIGYTVNNINHTYLSGEDKENNKLYGTIAINLFSGFKDKYNYDASKKINEIEQFKLNAIKQDIKLNTAIDMINVYRNIAYLKVTKNALKLYKEKYENIKLKYKVGLLTKNDLLKIKVEMDNSIQDTKRANADVNVSINNLNRETGLETNTTTLDFFCFNKLPEILDKNYYHEELLKQRSELIALKKYLEFYELKEKVSKSSLYPSVDLALKYTSYEDDYLPGQNNDISEDEVRAQLNLTMNIFDGFQKYSEIKKARLDIKNINYQITELEDDLKTAINNVLLDINVAFENLEVAKTSLDEANENLRITELSFEKGLATSTDILDAIFYLSRARFNIIDAEYSIFKSNFNLNRLIEKL